MADAHRRMWRLLRDPAADGPTNMAIDHALAAAQAAPLADRPPPTLRLYRWAPACLSIGAYQVFDREVDAAACTALGIQIVRRPTGARAILHDAELTYSLAAPADHPLVVGTILESYRAISAAVVAGLQGLAVAAALAPEPAARQAGVKSAACFDLPSANEVTVGGRKLMGSAQLRRDGALLQHGSLLLRADPARLARVLHLPPTLNATELGRRIIGLDQVLGRSLAWDEVAAAVAAGFRQQWGIDLVPGSLTPAEQQRAAELRAQFYAHDGWTRQRRPATPLKEAS